MELQAVTGQLHVVEGEVHSTSSVPGLLAQSAPPKAARGRERDFLFVHLTLTGSLEETAVLTQDLLDAVSRRFYQATGSVTAALRSAMTETNELLLRLNLSGASTAREGAITCAALHNGELFMLQTGESLALLGHNFGIERLPQDKPERVTPLGRTAGIDIRYYHHRLQSGNMLLLVDPRIAHLPADRFAPAMAEEEVEYGLEALLEAVGDDSARLLLVEFTEYAPAELPDVTLPVRPSSETLATLPQLTPQREDGVTVPVKPTTPVGDRRPQPKPPRRTAAPGAEIGRSRPSVDVEATARLASSEAVMGLSRLTGWLSRLLIRLRLGRPEDGDLSRMALPTILAIMIPVIVAVVVSGVYLQRGRVRRFAEIKADMAQNIVLAEEAAGDPEGTRNFYNAVLTLAVEAESLRPGDAEIDRLRSQALFALDRLDDVTRLDARLFYEYDEDVTLAAVVLRDGFNGGIYTLDSAGNTVFQHETDESYLVPTTSDPQAILVGGQAVGSHVVGAIVDLMWRPRGSAVTREGLAALDNAGTLFTYYPSFADIRAVPLGLSSEWRFPAAITSYDERLYILDVGMNEIWKYFPEGDGFVLKDDERSIAFSEDPGLNRSVDFAIYSEDGSLALLYGDGRLRYHDTRSGRVQWDEIHLMQNGLSTPILAPTAIELVGRGLNASIFIADPGSGRILQVSRGGTVLTQYRSTDETGQELFGQISDFAVAETPLRVFVTVGNKLYVATQE